MTELYKPFIVMHVI